MAPLRAALRRCPSPQAQRARLPWPRSACPCSRAHSTASRRWGTHCLRAPRTRAVAQSQTRPCLRPSAGVQPVLLYRVLGLERQIDALPIVAWVIFGQHREAMGTPPPYVQLHCRTPTGPLLTSPPIKVGVPSSPRVGPTNAAQWNARDGCAGRCGGHTCWHASNSSEFVRNRLGASFIGPGIASLLQAALVLHA